jgi:ornithine cyclodeaminase/alanine dehydrogenase-like protein (mu-crystallin family)
LGTGFQAGGQLEAISAVRRFDRVKVYSPTEENLRRFVDHFRKLLDLDIVGVDSPESAVEGADVLVTATNSVSPTIDPVWLKPGMHLSSIKPHRTSTGRVRARGPIDRECARKAARVTPPAIVRTSAVSTKVIATHIPESPT